MPDTIDAYIAALPEIARNAAQQLRRTIAGALPGAAETISYAIPAYAVDGKPLVYFAAWKHHLSLYPIPAGDAALQHELAPYRRGKGTLHFRYGDPLPHAVIARTVALLRAERAASRP